MIESLNEIEWNFEKTKSDVSPDSLYENLTSPHLSPSHFSLTSKSRRKLKHSELKKHLRDFFEKEKEKG